MSRKTWFIAAGALLLAAAVPAPAEAGIEPVPWRLTISNRSNAALPEPQPMTEMRVYVVVEDRLGTHVLEYPLLDDTGMDLVLPPGATFWVQIPAPATAEGGVSIVGWGFTATMGVGYTAVMGVEPSPWRVYAMEGTPAAPEEPATWPRLPPSLLSPEYGLYAFASPGTPGTLVGAVEMSSVEIFEGCRPDAAWKNHGQYVRCVALLVGDLAASGEVTEDEADAIVSAAARSAVGK